MLSNNGLTFYYCAVCLAVAPRRGMPRAGMWPAPVTSRRPHPLLAFSFWSARVAVTRSRKPWTRCRHKHGCNNAINIDSNVSAAIVIRSNGARVAVVDAVCGRLRGIHFNFVLGRARRRPNHRDKRSCVIVSNLAQFPSVCLTWLPDFPRVSRLKNPPSFTIHQVGLNKRTSRSYVHIHLNAAYLHV